MKFIITKSKMDDTMNRYLSSKKIEVKYSLLQIYSDDVVIGKFFLYKDGNRYVYQNGYAFVYRIIDNDKTNLELLEPIGDLKNRKRLTSLDEFKHFPEDILINYFSEKVKDYLIKKVN